MLKNEFMQEIYLRIEIDKLNFLNDRPAIRMLFNNHKDSKHKDGTLTDNQVDSWILTDRELNKCLTIARR